MAQNHAGGWRFFSWSWSSFVAEATWIVYREMENTIYKQDIVQLRSVQVASTSPLRMTFRIIPGNFGSSSGTRSSIVRKALSSSLFQGILASWQILSPSMRMRSLLPRRLWALSVSIRRSCLPALPTRRCDQMQPLRCCRFLLVPRGQKRSSSR